jgi:hypothetical protein
MSPFALFANILTVFWGSVITVEGRYAVTISMGMKRIRPGLIESLGLE